MVCVFFWFQSVPVFGSNGAGIPVKSCLCFLVATTKLVASVFLVGFRVYLFLALMEHTFLFSVFTPVYMYTVYRITREIRHPSPRTNFKVPFSSTMGRARKKKKRRTSRLLWTDLDEIVPTPPFSLCVPYKADCGREVAPKLDKITGSPRGVCVCYYYSMSCVAYGNNTVERKASAT